MQSEPRLISHFYIKIDGSDLDAQAMDDLVQITVESNLHLPDMFEIELNDEHLTWVDDGPFGLGKEVEISAVPQEERSSTPLMKGEITAIEPNFAEDTHAKLLVRGYDRSHRLHRGTEIQAHLQVTDSDLATKIAQEAGLQADVDATSEVYDHVLLPNETAMEFLAARAQRIGYEFFVEDRTLYFRRPSQNGDALPLEWGVQMRSFRPRQTLVEQVDEVTVKGWDPKTREVIIGQATNGGAEPEIGESESGAQLASGAFDSATRVVVDRYVKSQAEADTLAQAILDEISGAYIEAEGTCFGQPELRAGRYVDLSALGQRFSGTYFVTAATHIYDPDGYTTAFQITGRRPGTVLASLSHGASRANGHWSGPVVGVVTNNNDPDGWGRVKLKMPWLSEDVESDWARVVSVGAGPERGLLCLPEVNDEVLVAFEAGDVGRPYVLGGLWNGEDAPSIAVSEAVQNGEVHKRVFKTRVGHILTFTDGSEEGVTLETAGGHLLALEDEGQKVVLRTSAGQILTLDDSSNEITLEAGGDLTIKSNANLTIEAGASLELKGQTFSLNGNATGEVKSSGNLQIQGALVKIN